MFDHSGKTVMRLSKAFSPVGCGLTVFLCFRSWISLSGASVSVFLRILAFLAILCVGVFLSWLGAAALCAFGQMAEDLHQLRMDRAVEGSPGGSSSAYSKAGYTLPGQSQPPRQRRSQAGRGRSQAPQAEISQQQLQPQEAPQAPAAPVPPDDMVGRSGWIRADSIYIQCPLCGSRMTPEFAITHRGCPQCNTPYRP